MTLFHDVPSSEGVKNGLKRAKRMVEARFTPILPYPVINYSTDAEGNRTYYENRVSAWLPQKGLPYSSVRKVEKYIGYNVSFETFYSALRNPDSVVYTRPITGTAQNVHNYYGIVCSCFVSEVLDLPYRTPCVRIPQLPDITRIDPDPLENLRLLDLILHVKKHVAVITDIERDEDGIVRFITVSESTLPFCKVTRFTTEEFKGYWLDREFSIYRYAGVDRITYTPDPFLPIEEDGPMETPKINRVLMTDYGNKANYRLHEDVLVSVFEPGFDTLLLEGPDSETALIPVVEGKCTLLPKKAGFYSVKALRGEEESDPVLFCVTDLRFTMDKASYAPKETMKIRFENSADEPLLAWQFNRCANDRGCGGAFLTEAPLGNELTLTVPDVEESVELYIMAKNAYGVYTSDRIKVK